MTDEVQDVKLEIDLLGNAIDFILKGIDELFDEKSQLRDYVNPKDVTVGSFKYGILHLFSGFLLLLKERLHRHMPELMFKGKISDIRNKLQRNEIPNTVDLDEALERLEIGPRVVFFDSEIRVIRAMQTYRNQFEHYKVSANKLQLWSVISEFLSLVDKFLVNELKINIEDSIDDIDLRRKAELISTVLERILEQEKKNLINELERRLERFHENQEEILLELEHDRGLEEGNGPIFIECPQCGGETLIARGDYAGICIDPDCEATYPITRCDRCLDYMPGYSWEMNFCENCLAFIAESD